MFLTAHDCQTVMHLFWLGIMKCVHVLTDSSQLMHLINHAQKVKQNGGKTTLRNKAVTPMIPRRMHGMCSAATHSEPLTLLMLNALSCCSPWTRSHYSCWMSSAAARPEPVHTTHAEWVQLLLVLNPFTLLMLNEFSCCSPWTRSHYSCWMRSACSPWTRSHYSCGMSSAAARSEPVHTTHTL